MEEEYIVECWYCLGEFDAIKAAWCGHPEPTKICPYCLNCSCNAPKDYKKKFWDNAPPILKLERVKLTSVKQRLGEILVADKKISSEQLLAALNKQEKTGEKIGEILIKMGLIKKEELALYLLRQKTIPSIDILNKEVDIKLVQNFGIQTCLKYGIIPFLIEDLKDDTKRLHLAMANPYMPQLIKKLSKYMNAQIVYYQADKNDIEEKIKLILKVIQIKEVKKVKKDDKIFNGFKELLNFAIKKKATHLYLTKDFYKIRINMRINGTLFKVKSIDVRNIENYLEKLKTTLGLEPNENKFARKTYELNKNKYNLIIKNEGLAGKDSLEVAIINLNEFGQDLSKIGLSMYEVEDINAALSNNSGVITVSAPIFNETSSLMYSLINKIKGKRKILSIEKEILRKITEIEQIYFNNYNKNVIFELIYKLEPEIVFIHDLKSPEIMKEIFKISKNHLFVIEMYAKSSARTIIQLKDYFKIGETDLSDNLRLIINKRLIRFLCEKCKTKINPTIDSIDKLNLSEEDSLMFEFYKERGCQFCNFTGFSNRKPLFEVLKITDELKQIIKEGGDENIIQKIAIENGMITLSNNAMSLLSNGLTSANELRKQGLI
jgi:type IV pilus assembly protein PilB